MQKKLLGVAVAAALAAPMMASAQSTVQLYGTVHMSLNHTKFDDVVGGGDVSKFGVNSHATNYGIRSSETLGGGLTAWMQMEFNAQMERRLTSATGPGSHRNSGVGLRGGFGNIYIGTWETPWAQTFRLWDVGGVGGWGPTTSIMGRRETTNNGRSRNTTGADVPTQGAPAVGGVGTANLGYPLWRRFQSSVFYESPMFGGVQAKVAFQPNEMKTELGTPENPWATSASLTWTGMGGNARAFIATMIAKDWSTVGERDRGFTIGGGFNFGVANVGASFETFDYKGVGTGGSDVEAQQFGVGVSVPMGSGRIGASFARAKDLENVPGETGAKMWNVGYEWALSKRSVLGFGIAQMDNEADQGFTWTGQTSGPLGAAESVLPGTDQRNIFVSIRHSF